MSRMPSHSQPVCSIVSESGACKRVPRAAFLEALVAWRSRRDRKVHTRLLGEALRVDGPPAALLRMVLPCTTICDAMSALNPTLLVDAAFESLFDTTNALVRAPTAHESPRQDSGNSGGGTVADTNALPASDSVDGILTDALGLPLHGDICAIDDTTEVATRSVAMQALDSTAALLPATVVPPLLAAQVHVGTHNWAAARAAIAEALAVEPCQPLALLLAAHVAVEAAGDADAATTILDTALASSFKVQAIPSYVRLRAAVTSLRGDERAAFTMLRSAAKLATPHAGAMRTVEQAAFLVDLVDAYACGISGSPVEAERNLADAEHELKVCCVTGLQLQTPHCDGNLQHVLVITLVCRATQHRACAMLRHRLATSHPRQPPPSHTRTQCTHMHTMHTHRRTHTQTQCTHSTFMRTEARTRTHAYTHTTVDLFAFLFAAGHDGVAEIARLTCHTQLAMW